MRVQISAFQPNSSSRRFTSGPQRFFIVASLRTAFNAAPTAAISRGQLPFFSFRPSMSVDRQFIHSSPHCAKTSEISLVIFPESMLPFSSSRVMISVPFSPLPSSRGRMP